MSGADGPSFDEREVRQLDRLLGWVMQEAEQGLEGALRAVRDEPLPPAAIEDPAQLPVVRTTSRELRTHGRAVPLPPREGWVVAAGREALPAPDEAEDGADGDEANGDEGDHVQEAGGDEPDGQVR